MSINLNDNLIVQAPKATDERYGPYASEAEALLAIDLITRYLGLTAGVLVSGQVVEYWFKDGISDIDFVEKVSGAVPPSEPSIGFSCSDETSNLSAGLKFTFHVPYSLNLTGVFMSVNDAPTGDDLIVDIQLQGASIFSTLPSITSGRQYGGDGAVFSALYLPVDSKVTVYINQVGSTNAGTGLKVWLLGTKTPCDLPPYFCNTRVNSGCVLDFGFAWKYCSSISTFPAVDTSSGTNFSYAWKDCTGLTSISSALDLSAGTNFFNAWANCTSLTSFPLLNVSNGTDFSVAWANCTSLTSFPLLDVSNGTNFYEAWGNCTSLTSFPLLDVSSGTDFTGAWYNCTSLTSFPLLNVSNGTDFSAAWYGCTSLTSFPAAMFDSCLATNFTNAWQNCALNQTSVDNILVSIDTAGQSNGTLGIRGGTSAAPSATGLVAKASLQAKGWTVTTN